MAELQNFQANAHEALLDAAEQRAREDLAPRLKTDANELLTRYGQRHDYEVGTLVAAAQTAVERTNDRVTITLQYPEPALLFERGTVAHTVEARNAEVLSFIWERGHNPPQWVREDYDREGGGWRVFLPSVEVSGLPEAAFIRDALNKLRQDLQRL